jgi:hypothetical protein
VDYTYITLATPDASKIEVVKATAISGNTITVIRGQDNTTAQTFSVGDLCELRVTAAILESHPNALKDNEKLTFGDSDDLQIYHDGNDSYIRDVGTGLLFVRGSAGVRIQGANGENGITLNENASVDLYHNNSKKLATTPSGVDITGGLTASGKGSFSKPSDFWTTGYEGSSGVGSLATQGSFELHMTSNGYRNSSGTWTSLGSNGQTGAAQIALSPTGTIMFRTDAAKATGSTIYPTERMRLSSAGRLGIGTSAPTELLDIRGSHTTTRARLFYDDATTQANDAYLDFWASDPSISYNGSGIGSNVNGSPAVGRHTLTQGQAYISFRDGTFGIHTSSGDAVKRLHVTDLGYVGINTIAPTARLHVAGAIRTTFLIAENLTNLGSAAGSKELIADFRGENQNTSHLEISTYRTSAGSDWTTAGTRIQQRIDGTYQAYMQFNGSGNPSGISFGTGNAPVERMRLLSNGNISIGTTTSLGKLGIHAAGQSNNLLTFSAAQVDSAGNPINRHFSIKTPATTNVGDAFIFDTSNAFSFVVDLNSILDLDAAGFAHLAAGAIRRLSTTTDGVDITGSLNIGTNISSSKSDLSFTDNGVIGVEDSLSVAMAGSSFFRIMSGATSNTTGTAGSTERFRITSTGNVGIGTTAPTEKLHVVGTMKLQAAGADGIELEQDSSQSLNSSRLFFNTSAGGYALFNSSGHLTFRSGSIAGNTSGSEKVRIQAGGNVGIGLTSPTSKLHVSGAIKATSLIVDGATTSSNDLNFYRGGTKMGEIGCEDATWLRINQNTAKNIYTPRMIRADGGFQVDSKTVVSADGNNLYENSVALSTKYLGITAKAADADKLDGLNSTQFLRSDAADAMTQQVTFSACTTNNWDTIATASGSQGAIAITNSGAGNDAFMTFHAAGDYATYFGLDADTNSLSVGGWSMGAVKHKIWHAGNDGAGSGLDADKLDGLDSTQLLRNDGGSHSIRYVGGFRYASGANLGARYIHMKTSRKISDGSQMFSLTFRGHSYSDFKPINTSLVFYSYLTTGTPTSIGSSGTHTASVYKSSDGYNVLTLYIPNHYYVAFTMDQFTTNQGLVPLTITNAAVITSSTGAF